MRVISRDVSVVMSHDAIVINLPAIDLSLRSLFAGERSEHLVSCYLDFL